MGGFPLAKVHGDLRLQLISLDHIHLRPGELSLLLRHRFMLMSYLALVLALILVDANGRARELPLELRAPVYMLGVLVGLGVLVSYIRALALVLGRGGRVATVPLSPGLLMAAAAALFCSETLTRAMLVSPPMTNFQGILLTIFYFVLLEIIVSLVSHLVVPPALGDIRGEDIRVLADTARPAPEPEPEDNSPQEGPPMAMVVSGPNKFRAAEILAMEATGNYVNVTTDSGRKLVPGPFAAVLDQMPADLGARTHRSHWVAARAVAGYARRGRDMTVRMTNGQHVPVANPRQADITAWLRDLGVMDED